MKKLIYILFAFTLAVGFTACSDNDDSKGKTYLSTELISTFAHRSVNTVTVHTDESWNATTDVPWIQISPANGLRTADCKIIVDSTIVQHERDARVRFTFASGQTHFVKVEQSGYLPTIELKDTLVKLDNYGANNERFFDVNVLTNVKFNIKVKSVNPDGSTSWLTSDPVHFNFDRGARPRDVKVRFRWQNNNIPFDDRQLLVTFDPMDEQEYEFDRKDSLYVVQKAGVLIEDSRKGDSLAILGIIRGLNTWYISDPTEPFNKWGEVELWQPTDEGYTKEKNGRVRKANFRFFTTTDALPYELRYLKHMETLFIASNSNWLDLKLNTGESLSYLKDNLKNLTIYGYGLTNLDETFVELTNLEYLDLSANNFTEVPRILTQENFPNLKHLDLGACMINNQLSKDNIRFFTWDNLESLALNVNEIFGNIPTEKEISDFYKSEKGIEMPTYTEEDCIEEKLPLEQVGKLKILPNMKDLRINLNRLTGTLPQWVLYHPLLEEWIPYIFIFNQEGRDPDGKLAGFVNEPFNLNYYYEYYNEKYPKN